MHACGSFRISSGSSQRRGQDQRDWRWVRFDFDRKTLIVHTRTLVASYAEEIAHKLHGEFLGFARRKRVLVRDADQLRLIGNRPR